MRQLIPRESEPITPLVERVRQLYEAWSVSTVLVIGGVGDYLAVADQVIAMQAYFPRDVTEAARAIAPKIPEAEPPLQRPMARSPQRAGLRADKIRARDEDRLRYGGEEVKLGAVEQVLNADHAFSLGAALRLLHDELIDNRRTLPQLLDALDAILDDEGVEALSAFDPPDGRLIRPRRHEVAAALNRVRTLQIDERD